ncbi:MAG: biotin--[Prevotella sp.]|nr:biotin--[acetyl-CoA-carboxylase] ligase [Prevotella sp.]
MEWKITHIDETDSTNRWLRNCTGGQSSCAIHEVVWADYQTAGRGQGTNTWESERGKNLTFSILLHPVDLPANRQFLLSMQVSLAICEALGEHIGDLSIKWPNDIYWRNAKIAGILIENRLQGSVIRDSIVGVGLNVNQRQFHSDAPNPISLWQICEHETDREQLLKDILAALDRLLGQEVRERYLAMLYRRKGFHPYVDKDGAFMAELEDVEDDGHLLLCDDSGGHRRYAFKEVTFI